LQKQLLIVCLFNLLPISLIIWLLVHQGTVENRVNGLQNLITRIDAIDRELSTRIENLDKQKQDKPKEVNKGEVQKQQAEKQK
jgi:hypothetical protein